MSTRRVWKNSLWSPIWPLPAPAKTERYELICVDHYTQSLLRSPRPHRRSLYTDNGRHKNKNQAAPAPTGNGRHKTNKHEAATARARDVAPRARGTDASIPSGRAGTDECADAD